MPRLILIAAAATLALLCSGQAFADDPTPQGGYLSWPGKQGSSPPNATVPGPANGAVALPKQFFAGASGADMAAPPGPLMPHPVPGSPSVTNSSTANTAANRARADMLTPTGDQSSDQ